MTDGMREIQMTLSPKQMEAMRLRQKYIGYGGARGGGKSYFVRAKCITMALAYPGCRILLVRSTYDELRHNHITPLLSILGDSVRYNTSQKVINFPNGSIIQCGYLAKEGDAKRYQGTEWDEIFIDEATNIKEEWLKDFPPCLRGIHEIPRHIIYTCNPGGVSHSYIKRLFVDRRYEGSENPADYAFVQAKVYDNWALMRSQPEYVQQLESLPPQRRKAWLEGSWELYEGQFFESFTDDKDNYTTRRYTHVISAFVVPQGWKIIRSFDWGYNRPFSCGYYAFDYDNVMYRIAELYGVERMGGQVIPNQGVKQSPDEVFQRIRDFEDTHPLLRDRKITGVADPAIWDVQYGVSIMETASKYGIYFSKGDHKRLAGWMQCQTRLRFDDNGYPQFYCFDECTEFIRTIPTLQYDPKKPEDLDTEGEDHIADEWRYACMSRTVTPMAPEAKYMPMYGSDPLNQFRR